MELEKGLEVGQEGDRDSLGSAGYPGRDLLVAGLEEKHSLKEF